ncbi:hypothetical protein SPHINGO391_490099 [Sphingomonas aurantiaca]|uniref:Uncharacterized protein n=1 Tax=Sphingomonas aurantiaca TaxID=185949 RepID=A0A5E8A4B7_9SPHN|nr:hypothetical protein SPHINGO391_490099 [Sphingomonas aurantiaca]
MPIRHASFGFSPAAKLAINWSRDSIVGLVFFGAGIVVIAAPYAAMNEPARGDSDQSVGYCAAA